ncbi:MAG: L-histidine N(alpha)-methyltransferase [Terriglobales bacterium]
MAPSIPVPASGPTPLLQDVLRGLNRPGQKRLPCKYLYDAVGSLLFEAICALPEYGLTAADERILRANADDIAAGVDGAAVIELGSGSARKSRWLLEAFCRRRPTLYTPIEISPTALERCQRELGGLGHLTLRPLQAEYLAGLAALLRPPAPPSEPRLVLFLGSSLGNFEPSAAHDFLAQIAALLQPPDALLLGLDLVKPPHQLLAAYDDPAGVTAAFNLNLLVRLNRELGADFDLRQWRHEVRYLDAPPRVEMHLRARCAQRVRLAGVTVAFRRGETIWTESSHKFNPDAIAALARSAGFRLDQTWTDRRWPFAEVLLRPAPDHGPAV